jgi:uncharacterized protein YqhQ
MSEQNEPLRLGGMALANGLLVHGPTHWAAAVRDRDGELRVAGGRKLRLARGPLARIPLVRGVLRIGEAMAVVPTVRRGLPQARLAMEDAPVGAAFVVSTGLAALARWRFRSVVAQESAAAIAGLLPALVAVNRSDAARWHAVEHKSIGAYESGSDADDAPKEHTRCGGNLILPLLVTSVAGRSAMRKLFRSPPAAVKLGVAAASLGISLEVFGFASRRPGHPVSRVVHWTGHALQSGISTREPRQGDMAVGQAAMDEIIRLEDEEAK